MTEMRRYISEAVHPNALRSCRHCGVRHAPRGCLPVMLIGVAEAERLRKPEPVSPMPLAPSGASVADRRLGGPPTHWHRGVNMSFELDVTRSTNPHSFTRIVRVSPVLTQSILCLLRHLVGAQSCRVGGLDLQSDRWSDGCPATFPQNHDKVIHCDTSLGVGVVDLGKSFTSEPQQDVGSCRSRTLTCLPCQRIGPPCKLPGIEVVEEKFGDCVPIQTLFERHCGPFKVGLPNNPKLYVWPSIRMRT